MFEDIFDNCITELQGTINSDLGSEVITKTEWDEDPFAAVVRHLNEKTQ